MRIVFKNADGSIGIITPTLGARLDGESADDFLARIADKDVPKDALSFRLMNTEGIPTDRTFRAAWTDTSPDAIVDIDMDKARQLKLDQFRALRKPKLEALDLATLKALEGKNIDSDIAIIKAKKQALRDITITFDLTQFKTPDALKSAIPDELK